MCPLQQTIPLTGRPASSGSMTMMSTALPISMLASVKQNRPRSLMSFTDAASLWSAAATVAGAS